MNPEKQILLNELISKSLENNISSEECSILNGLLESDEAMATYYVKSMRLRWGLRKKARLFQIPEQSLSDHYMDNWFLKELAVYERIAPSVSIEKPPVRPAAVLPPPCVERSRVSKFSLVSLILSAAALIFVILFVHITPATTGVEVATLTDSISAKWDSSMPTVANGTRFVTGFDYWLLREGLAQLQFDNGTHVAIEAPAEFQILTGDQVQLNYGRIYAVVPPQAYGFTVNTRHSKIIDLGTEFGIQAEVDGGMEVHVTKGKVNLLSGLQGKKIHVAVDAGFAKELDAVTGELMDVECSDTAFVRRINSEMGIVWKGQKRVDLADIVGGGNGLGTGRRDSHLDILTGRWKPASEIINAATVQNETKADRLSRYVPVQTNPFVDGLFIPDGEYGPLAISSAGHTFGEAPDTSGTNWGGIVNVERVLKRSIELNGVLYGTPQRSALFMHANGGITFDLEKIREAFSGQSLREFQAVYGISDTYPTNAGREAYADFWVLVDGEIRFTKTGVRVHEGDLISMPIADTDRFLTLVTTDGGQDSTERGGRTSFNDWCVFGEPVLIFE